MYYSLYLRCVRSASIFSFNKCKSCSQKQLNFGQNCQSALGVTVVLQWLMAKMKVMFGLTQKFDTEIRPAPQLGVRSVLHLSLMAVNDGRTRAKIKIFQYSKRADGTIP